MYKKQGEQQVNVVDLLDTKKKSQKDSKKEHRENTAGDAVEAFPKTFAGSKRAHYRHA